MKITINGTEEHLENASDLKALIQHFCQEHNHIIAEVNGHIVKTANWQETPIQDGDKIELVSFVGGG